MWRSGKGWVAAAVLCGLAVGCGESPPPIPPQSKMSRSEAGVKVPGMKAGGRTVSGAPSPD